MKDQKIIVFPVWGQNSKCRHWREIYQGSVKVNQVARKICMYANGINILMEGGQKVKFKGLRFAMMLFPAQKELHSLLNRNVRIISIQIFISNYLWFWINHSEWKMKM